MPSYLNEALHKLQHPPPPPRADRTPPMHGRIQFTAQPSSTPTALMTPPAFRLNPSTAYSKSLAPYYTIPLPSIPPCSVHLATLSRRKLEPLSRPTTMSFDSSTTPHPIMMRPSTILPATWSCTSIVTPRISTSPKPEAS